MISPFGILEVDSREPRRFTRADTDFLRTYANLLADAIERVRILRELRAAVAEKERLLRELQHRVKNNNQSLLSLIHLQLASVTNLEARENLQKIEHRIRALSFVNAQLQVGVRANIVDLGQYLMAIIGSLFNFQNDGGSQVKLTTRISQLEVATERAQAIGLILNEFLTNSSKVSVFSGVWNALRALTSRNQAYISAASALRSWMFIARPRRT